MIYQNNFHSSSQSFTTFQSNLAASTTSSYPTILGITNNDDSSACLLVNGKIISAVQEERFSRIKLDNRWPQNSIAYVLNEANIKLSDVDYLAYGWSTGFNADKLLLKYLDRSRELAEKPKAWLHFRKRISNEIYNDRDKRNEFLNFARINGFEGKTLFIDHHTAHSLGAYCCSPYKDALIVTCDGRGDFRSFTISKMQNGLYSTLHEELTHDSLGYFYGRITHLLGHKPNRHEGKVTGLAARGNPNKCKDLMRQMIDCKDGKIRANLGKWYEPSYKGYSDVLIEKIRQFDSKDIAAAAQEHLEYIICSIIQKYIPYQSSVNLCLAGGVFGNVRLNQKVRELPNVNSVFVLPCMGDGGLSLAAAVAASYTRFGIRCSLNTMSLGPSYDHKFNPAMIPEKITAQCTEIEKEIIEAISTDKVVGFVRGRMEFGPRALCKRSIIYHAKDTTVNNWLNKRLNRTEYMPFAPVTAENLANKCYKRWKADDITSHYMTMTYNCTDFMNEKCPAVVHTDGTARPQIVSKNDDPFMYSLLNAWFKKTGEPALINTSFNRHEEPIINKPEEAFDALISKVVDLLCISDKYILKRNSSAWQR
ncbi:MAG: carbamoyltransferase C-terminal domain-containing protein [Tenacibaculum sp.]